jgi:hypothetical protein
MATKIDPGVYDAVVTSATIYEAPSGAVMCRMALDIGLTGGVCLIQKDGNLSERGFKDVQAIFGWPEWDWAKWDADPETFAGAAVQAVVETVAGDHGDFSSVKYINPPGGGGAGMVKADAKGLAAKYGAKTRALLGGAPARPGPTPTAATTPPVAPVPPVTMPPAKSAPKKRPAPPPAAAVAPTATMEDCWAAFCAANDGKAETELYDFWHASVKEITGKDQNTCTPEDWGKMMARMDNLPF